MLILIYSAVCTLIIYFFLHFIGKIASFLSLPGGFVKVVSQLERADIKVPFWQLALGVIVLVISVYIIDFTVKKESRTKRVLIIIYMIICLLLFFIAAFMNTRVNNVPVKTEIKILINILDSGALD